jgi:hypothetical protein
MLTLFSPSRDHPYFKLLSQIHDAPTVRQTWRYNSSRPMVSTSKRFVICEQYRRSICLLVLICTTSGFKVNLRQQTRARRRLGCAAPGSLRSEAIPSCGRRTRFEAAGESLRPFRKPDLETSSAAPGSLRSEAIPSCGRRTRFEVAGESLRPFRKPDLETSSRCPWGANRRPPALMQSSQSPHYRVLESHVDSRSKPVGSLATHDITAHANAATCSTQGGFTSSRVSCGYGREDQILSRHLFILAMLAIFVLLASRFVIIYSYAHSTNLCPDASIFSWGCVAAVSAEQRYRQHHATAKSSQ